MTNALGHQFAAMHALEDDRWGGITLGAYRAGRRVSWVPGATIDVWTKCARGEIATGVSWPHCYFIQTIGGSDGGSIHCPTCRAELAAARATGKPTLAPPPISRAPTSSPPQETLPF